MGAVQFPDVPLADGVPPVLRQIGAVTAPVVLLLSDAASLLSDFLTPAWGIFTQDGLPLVPDDSVLGFDYRREWRVADFPLEQGAFGSYNKVQTPYEARVTYAVGDSSLPNLPGSQTTRRGSVLAAIDAAAASLDLFTVITPEFTYSSANIIHYDYRRTAQNGAGMLIIDVWVQEIRIAQAAQVASTQQPAGAAMVDDGTVQTAPLTPAQQSALPPLTDSGTTILSA